MVVTAGIFEKFTEKAIKAVMLAQTFASRMQSAEVGTQWVTTRMAQAMESVKGGSVGVS